MEDLNYAALALGVVYMVIVLAFGAFLLTLVYREYKKHR
jgi:hypothetical protein